MTDVCAGRRRSRASLGVRVNMTGRERVLAVIEGRPVDHLPCMPITMMFAADILGVRYRDYVSDYRILADAQMKTAEMFSLDYVSVISSPTREASDYGARIEWYDDQPPAINEEHALFADKLALKSAKLCAPESGPRMSDRLRAVELLRQRAGNDLLVEGWVEGPCAEAADLRGINRLMLDFSDDPEFVHDLFDFALEGAIRFAVAQIAAGADIIGVGDAAASLVGPRVYKQFVVEWERKLIDAIHAAGGRVRLHICGNTSRLLDGFATLGADLIDIDYPVALDKVRAATGLRQAIDGNLDPVRDVRNGTPESIQRALTERHQQVGSPWIVSAGCEIVRDTPHQNLHAMVQFAKLHNCDA